MAHNNLMRYQEVASSQWSTLRREKKMKVENRAPSDLPSLSRTAFFSIKQIAEFDIFWLLKQVQKKIISKKKITSRGRSTRKQDADNTRCWQRKDNWSRGVPPLPLPRHSLPLYHPPYPHCSFLSSCTGNFRRFCSPQGGSTHSACWLFLFPRCCCVSYQCTGIGTNSCTRPSA